MKLQCRRIYHFRSRQGAEIAKVGLACDWDETPVELPAEATFDEFKRDYGLIIGRMVAKLEVMQEYVYRMPVLIATADISTVSCDIRVVES